MDLPDLPGLRGYELICSVTSGRRVRYELANPKLGARLADLADLVLLVDHGARHQACDPDSDCCRPADVDVSDVESDDETPLAATH